MLSAGDLILPDAVRVDAAGEDGFAKMSPKVRHTTPGDVDSKLTDLVFLEVGVDHRLQRDRDRALGWRIETWREQQRGRLITGRFIVDVDRQRVSLELPILALIAGSDNVECCTASGLR